MKGKLFILSICILLMVGCQPKNSTKNRLRQRVNKYYEYLLKKEFGLSWDLLWNDAKRIRNRDEWIAFAQEFDKERKLEKIQIKSISIKNIKNRKVGIVVGIGIYSDLKQKINVQYEDEEMWLFENGDWFRMVE